MAKLLGMLRFACEQRSRPQKVPDYDDEIRKLDGERAKMVGLVLSLDSCVDCRLPILSASAYCLLSALLV